MPKTKCLVILKGTELAISSLAHEHNNAMGVRASIVVCVTSFLLGDHLHHLFVFPISFPGFCRFSIYPLDRRLIDAVEVTRHR